MARLFYITNKLAVSDATKRYASVFTAQRIYWSNTIYGLIQSVDMNGLNYLTVSITNQQSRFLPYWVSSVENFTYYSDINYSRRGIRRYDKISGKIDIIGDNIVVGLTQIIYFKKQHAYGLCAH